MAEDRDIRLPATISGWALTVAYTALVGLFSWVLSLDREMSRVAAVQKQVIAADDILRSTLMQEIVNRRDDMVEVRRQNEAIRDLLQRHTEFSINGKGR